jgi:hypothetical protein
MTNKTGLDAASPFFFFFVIIIIIVLLDCLEINKNEEVKNSCPFEILILQDLISFHLKIVILPFLLFFKFTHVLFFRSSFSRPVVPQLFKQTQIRHFAGQFSGLSTISSIVAR